MLNLGLTAFFAFLMVMGLRRPFIWILCYLYIDIVAPQIISWGFLSMIPTSLIAFAAAFLGWLAFDDKTDSRFTWRQGVMVALLVYCGLTTLGAVYPTEALQKWAWVWKALVFAIFLPLTLRTRLRIEATVLVMVLAVSTLIVDGGLKTAMGGGGYGELRIFVENNTGLYEGSILSCVAIAIIPVVLWLARYSTVFPTDWRVKTYAAALIFACCLIPIGTAARTGLVCLVVVCLLYLRTARHRFAIMAGMALAAFVAIPFLPQSYVARMDTIEDHQSDQSASTRLGVWKWTIGFAREHPFGGGFMAYLSSHVDYDTVTVDNSGGVATVHRDHIVEKGRAFHSSYFEMLGEQGYPGLALWLLLQVSGLWQMEAIRRRWKDRTAPGERWAAPLANALQLAQVSYMIGSLFVGIAFQAFILDLIGLQCALWTYLRRIEKTRDSRGESAELGGPATARKGPARPALRLPAAR
ncbi:putative O-glycosylation ligase, exosortase A system-associated [Novosphingobium sp. 1949]|uniref:O-glycosylation ligase, exosortase A system-associated n=1 Tax=Novosphingobium organovorum TaxID=2930092 RepID=A0ABT0BHV9_9SPHN|nr:putative O-glycosylation ligase, exosortase A system-associated [Novosphingobium organovorum]MCJ2184647.1 putative O-glycosylation ligase, exosortase A system-associated [Novosphingobium organovorum]